MKEELSAFRGRFHSVIFIGANLKEEIPGRRVHLPDTLDTLRRNSAWEAFKIGGGLAVQFMNQ